MKNFRFLLLLLLSTVAFSQSTKPLKAPNGLDISMTTVQKNALTNKVVGQLVYDSTLAEYQKWDGSTFVSIGGGGSQDLDQTATIGNSTLLPLNFGGGNLTGELFNEGNVDEVFKFSTSSSTDEILRYKFEDVDNYTNTLEIFDSGEPLRRLRLTKHSLQMGFDNQSFFISGLLFGTRNNASGYDSLTFGINNTNNHNGSFVGGNFNNAPGFGKATSFLFGRYNQNNGGNNYTLGSYNTQDNTEGFVFGDYNTTFQSGGYTHILGSGNNGNRPNQVIIGNYSIDEDPYAIEGTIYGYSEEDKVLIVGNGTNDNGTVVRSNALNLYRNGLMTLPSSTNSLIATDPKAVITKEYADANYSGGGGGAVTSVNSQTGDVFLTQDNIGDGTTNKVFTNTEKTKLSGIATGATANQSDAVTNTAIATKVNANTTITGATKTKITYDSKGLVTGGSDLTDTDIPTLAQSKISGLEAALENSYQGLYRNQNPSVSATVAGVNTLFYTIPIAPNKLRAQSLLDINAGVQKYGTANYVTLRMYLSTNATFSVGTSTLLASFINATTTKTSTFKRSFRFPTATTISMYDPLQNANTDEMNLVGYFTTLTVDLTNQYYIHVTGTVQDSADSVNLLNINAAYFR